MHVRNLRFIEVSFGSYLVVNFMAQFWFICTRLWLDNCGPILAPLTVLIFVRVAINTKYNLLLRYKFHTFQSNAYKVCNFVTKWYKSTFACFLMFERSSHALRLVPFMPASENKGNHI